MSLSSSLLVVAVVVLALYVLAALVFPERFE
ncbi:potassium-transporting ATPase subunit F [Nocardioides hwasunensis]|uniref:Potassium-transporting ATPase subunit F n=1 Tax=Nocardioides hwasunensis TaxID=397258 RepID=A0ABR8MK64_9ACTN|nr:potassium-transporting ATPase subunit F [Nocardioides hwasunensis]MBD3916419.1 potassium-transporting ATPase subunit F [Nocardioides hwasunensis]